MQYKGLRPGFTNVKAKAQFFFVKHHHVDIADIGHF